MEMGTQHKNTRGVQQEQLSEVSAVETHIGQLAVKRRLNKQEEQTTVTKARQKWSHIVSSACPLECWSDPITGRNQATPLCSLSWRLILRQLLFHTNVGPCLISNSYCY